MALLWVVFLYYHSHSSYHVHWQEAQPKYEQTDADHPLRLQLDFQTFSWANVQPSQSVRQAAIADSWHEEREKEPKNEQNEVNDKVGVCQVLLMDAEALMLTALFSWRKHGSIDQRLDQQQRPNYCTQLPDKLLLFHAGVSVEVHNGCVPMDADESEEYSAAVEMRTKQGNLHLAQEPTKGPVVANGKGHRHHGSDRGGDGVADGQVELQRGSWGPAGHSAAEYPQAEDVEEEAQEEDQAHEDGDGHMLGLPNARSRVIAAVPKLWGNYQRLHLPKNLLAPYTCWKRAELCTSVSFINIKKHVTVCIQTRSPITVTTQ